MTYGSTQFRVTNSDLLKYRKELADVAGTCGVQVLGALEPQAQEDTDFINIAVGMPLKSMAEDIVPEVRKLMNKLVPDHKFVFYPAGDVYIRKYLTVLYDGKLLYE